jgi:hypothetical protein
VSGTVPPVVDAKDILIAPKRTLGRLCQQVGSEFTEKMLSWPAGSHPQDGVWAPHWYDGVYRSTGFDKYQSRDTALPARYAQMCDEATRLYNVLAAHRL